MRERHGLSQRTDLTGVAGEQRDASRATLVDWVTGEGKEKMGM